MKKIYTKTGDKGETSLFTGKRVPKDDSFMHALGTVDECNAVIGIVLSVFPEEEGLHPYREQLVAIQHALFDLGAAVATPRSSASQAKINKTRFGHDGVDQLEKWIDEIDAKLPPLKTFILPGGHPAAAHLHLARNVCRRAERHVIPLNLHEAVNDHVLVYLNRLSDYFFVLTRLINQESKTAEISWQHHISDVE